MSRHILKLRFQHLKQLDVEMGDRVVMHWHQLSHVRERVILQDLGTVHEGWLEKLGHCTPCKLAKPNHDIL